MTYRVRESGWQLVAAILCPLLALSPAMAEQPPAGQGDLRIVVVEGDGARNVIQQIPPRPLIVRVENSSGRPVSQAVVLFSAPDGGPGGEFANGASTYTVVTGDNGLAVAGGYHPNSQAGTYRIQVRAELQGRVAAATMTQTNIARKGKSGKFITILLLAGGAVGAGYAAQNFRNNKKNTSASPAPTITFGGSAVGAPRQ